MTEDTILVTDDLSRTAFSGRSPRRWSLSFAAAAGAIIEIIGQPAIATGNNNGASSKRRLFRVLHQATAPPPERPCGVIRPGSRPEKEGDRQELSQRPPLPANRQLTFARARAGSSEELQNEQI